jgi:hypothetical protein
MSEKTDISASVAKQAWFSLAFWMTAGLLLEGLIAFRTPAYLQDPVRREMFRLAHAHGTVLNILMLVAGLYLAKGLIAPPTLALWSLRLGVVAMPLGFLLGGVWHYESDPGLGVFLAPVGGLMIIFGVIAAAMSSRGKEVN